MKESLSKKIVLIGCGKMGAAILSAIIKSKISDDKICVIRPFLEGLERLPNDKITHYKYLTDCLEKSFDAIIIAVKPQSFEDSLGSLKNYIEEKTVIISIAAGKSIESISNYSGVNSAIIRSMPNLPAMISQGITGYFCNNWVRDNHKETATQILSSFGNIIELDDESDINSITAVSGSGPAYMFNFLNSFANAAIELGFTQDQANQLVLDTCKGSISLAEKVINEKKGTFLSLQQDVTSKGGTTEAALKVLTNDNLVENLLKKAIKAAKNRAEELSN